MAILSCNSKFISRQLLSDIHQIAWRTADNDFNIGIGGTFDQEVNDGVNGGLFNRVGERMNCKLPKQGAQ